MNWNNLLKKIDIKTIYKEIPLRDVRRSPLIVICHKCNGKFHLNNLFTEEIEIEKCKKCGELLTYASKMYITCIDHGLIGDDRLDDNCSKCGKKLIQIPFEFVINEHLSVSLNHETENTLIYVDRIPFRHCKYILLGIVNKPKEIKDSYDYEDINSAMENLEIRNEDDSDIELNYIEAFIGHCSNLETWIKNNYSTLVLDYRLSFPLLEELSNAGDKDARDVYKKELLDRIWKGTENVKAYLFQKKYLKHFSDEETKDIKNNITNIFLKKVLLFPNSFIDDIFDIRKGKFIISESGREKIGIKNLNEVPITSFDHFKAIIPYYFRKLIPKIKFRKTTYYDFDSLFVDEKGDYGNGEEHFFESEFKAPYRVRNVLTFKHFWKAMKLMEYANDTLIYIPEDYGIFRFVSQKKGLDLIIVPDYLTEVDVRHTQYKYKIKVSKNRLIRQKIRKNKRFYIKKINQLREILKRTNYRIKNYKILGKNNTSVRLVLENKEETDMYETIKDYNNFILFYDKVKSLKLAITSEYHKINNRTKRFVKIFHLSTFHDKDRDSIRAEINF
jgi:hypothetical protein